MLKGIPPTQPAHPMVTHSELPGSIEPSLSTGLDGKFKPALGQAPGDS